MSNGTSSLPIAGSACREGREARRTFMRGLVLLLFFGDMLAAYACLAGGHWLRFHSFLRDLGVDNRGMNIAEYIPQFILALGVLAVLLAATGRYHRDCMLRPRYGTLLMLKPILYWGAIFAAVSLTIKMQPMLSRLFVFYSLLLLLVFLPLWRFVVTHFFIRRTLGDALRHKTLGIGWCPEMQQVLARSENTAELFPLKITGIIGLQKSDDLSAVPPSVACWKELDAFETVLRAGNYDTVMLADSGLPVEKKRKIQQLCAREMLDFMVLPSMDRLTSCLVVETMQGVPVLTQSRRPLDQLGNAMLKRAVDILGAVVGLTLFSPVIAYFCWRVKRESPGPVFYRQVRTGRHGRPFEIIKIRSMKLDAEAASGAQWCQEDDPRRLKVGAFMRRTNIDELPQFWNVLKGDMSLVGPRPERPELIADFKSQIDYYNLRHTIKPGLTGWAQVNGWRGDTCLRSRIACDIEYIERASPWFDAYIMLKTLTARENAY